MKKQIIVGLILFFTANSFAQNKEFIGDWKEVYYTQIDTLESGADLVKLNPSAYRDGILTLDPSCYLTKKNYSNKIVKIKEDLGVLWFAMRYKSDYVKKIKYDATKNEYLITKGSFTIHDLTIKYDKKSQHLKFIDKKNKIVMYEFLRKK